IRPAGWRPAPAAVGLPSHVGNVPDALPEVIEPRPTLRPLSGLAEAGGGLGVAGHANHLARALSRPGGPPTGVAAAPAGRHHLALARLGVGRTDASPVLIHYRP